MPGYKEKNKYRKKRSRVFTGIKKQDIQDGGPTTSTNPSICSPVKLNRSFEKIKANCPLLEAERNQIVTRKRAFELGVNNDERTTLRRHISYKLMDVTLLQESISKAEICSECKKPKISLQLW